MGPVTLLGPDRPLDSLATTARRVAALLMGSDHTVFDATSTDLEFAASLDLQPLSRGQAPTEVWAVDGGQTTVADARCLQVLATRASRVRFEHGTCTLEDEGELRTHLVGGADERAAALADLGLAGLGSDTTVDINLLRDRWEWDAVQRCIADANPGAMVLVDGDLQPDWRIPSVHLAAIFSEAAAKGVTLAAVVKHSSLSRGGAPLLGQLEIEAAAAFGERAMWWAPIAHTRADVSPGIQVVAARLDPDARYSFRIDLPAGADPEPALAALSATADDAAFPGYPYPLSVADRLAACPGWLRQEVWLQLDEHLERAAVPAAVRERAFADRHKLMERA